MRSRTPILVLTGGLLLLLGASALIWKSNSEPRFQGKGIRWYLNEIDSPEGTNSYHKFLVAEQAAKALQQMGPPAVAWLATRLERRETTWEKCYRTTWGTLPVVISRHMRRPRPAPGPMSYDLLEPKILQALIKVGPGATRVLTNYLATTYEVNTRYQVYMAMISYGPAFQEALPMLEHNLTLTNGLERVAAPMAIARIDPSRAAESVALLRAALASGETQYRAMAADFLAWFGGAAKPAIPELEAALNDPDPKIRERARVALQKITGQRIPKK